tara:strand:+ start:40 stop:225 length:186 start_codon:yes stop_codon:yes gene_type:complete
MSKWINIEDKHPKHNGDVLLIDENLEFYIGFITKGLPFDDAGVMIDGITHWQKLPQTPSYA